MSMIHMVYPSGEQHELNHRPHWTGDERLDCIDCGHRDRPFRLWCSCCCLSNSQPVNGFKILGNAAGYEFFRDTPVEYLLDATNAAVDGLLCETVSHHLLLQLLQLLRPEVDDPDSMEQIIHRLQGVPEVCCLPGQYPVPAIFLIGVLKKQNGQP